MVSAQGVTFAVYNYTATRSLQDNNDYHGTMKTTETSSGMIRQVRESEKSPGIIGTHFGSHLRFGWIYKIVGGELFIGWFKSLVGIIQLAIWG